ncbi:Vps51/Vps67-domain-containing protein [Colletotrichum navitas]|uniref:Vacuolar protein sorting-associated protein 51 homolog n=1 Tax=Colletotrichum navitas TaxID=681940 RepID=A0AAD8V5F0_9PEZI|nr:Vps51/Vps67-domain-containing protein [Colletotrichum navitas]KAK1590194.1 Vps51/Vps67-domain-containing protein [Colletotrichum navitas]
MSTIASPREPSLVRRVSAQQHTPTSSTRPSLDVPRSLTSSPNPGSAAAFANGPGGPPAVGSSKRANRAALREYYNLKKTAGGGAPSLEVTEDASDRGGFAEHSEVPPSELDSPSFDADAYVRKALAENSLDDLLRVYTRVLGEIRALDAEKKALVYDNYSKLISATETIRKMRANMDPLNPMASTLDPAIAGIYAQASSIRDSLRKTVAPPDSEQREDEAAAARRRRTRQLAREVLGTPEKLRMLMAQGKVEEAKKEWEMPRRLLEVWKEKGVGGKDVAECLEEGDAAIRGGTGESSMLTSKDSRSS